jgi:hypothetical protein
MFKKFPQKQSHSSILFWWPETATDRHQPKP